MFDFSLSLSLSHTHTHNCRYEKQTRKIRYDTYKRVLKDISGRGVMFGHHCGDVQENVISNFFKANSNLSGMQSTGVVNGVQIWRPLLLYRKENIIEFAHQFGVPYVREHTSKYFKTPSPPPPSPLLSPSPPLTHIHTHTHNRYFKDTTPEWSTRGKMRNQLIPLLKDMFGPGVLSKLSILANDSDATNSMVEEYMFDPLMRLVVRSSVCVRLDCREYLNRPVVFWKEILKRIFHSMKTSCPTNRAIGMFFETLRPPVVKKTRKKRRSRNDLITDPSDLCDEVASLDKNVLEKTYWPTLKKEHHVLLHKGILYVFDSKVRFLKSPKRRPKGEKDSTDSMMRVSLKNSSSSSDQIKFRGWDLILTYSNNNNNQEKEMKKLLLDDFASGNFNYLVAIPGIDEDRRSSLKIELILDFHHRKAQFMSSTIPPRVRQLIPSVRYDGKLDSRKKCTYVHVSCRFSP